ncbi:hypothetical protein ACNKHO_21775 [Shigella flexneri]
MECQNEMVVTAIAFVAKARPIARPKAVCRNDVIVISLFVPDARYHAFYAREVT